MSADEEWVQAAMSDDSMVVDLLVRLHRPSSPPKPNPLFPLHWTVRQRRSRSTSLNNTKNKQLSQRNSPTTPLSWSGGATSISGGASEDSSIPFKLPDTTRSKVNCDNDKTPSKRPRKKKTLAQLKEEENLLVRERRDLNKEITALRMKLERERATNNSLKRIKLNLKPESDGVVIASQEESVSGKCMPSTTGNNISQTSAASNSGLEQNADARFVLPDLNMPFDDPSSDVICGVS